MGSASRYLGILAAALERWDMAGRHFEVAIEMESQIEARPLVAWSQYHHAHMLYREGRDLGSAERVAAAALEHARELDLPALAERVLSLAP